MRKGPEDHRENRVIAVVLILGGLTDLWLPALVAMSVLILGDALDQRAA